MKQKEKIHTLEQWIIDRHGYKTLTDIYMQHKVDATNKILEIADADEFNAALIEIRNEED